MINARWLITSRTEIGLFLLFIPHCAFLCHSSHMPFFFGAPNDG
jgi:hypothetical protein